MVKKANVLGRVRGGGVNVRDYGLLGALVVIVMFFQFMTHGKLLYSGNVNNLIMQNAYVVILAVGMVMVIIAGHIDLSVGSLVAMIGAIVALAIKDWGMPWPLAIVIALLAGALVGIWQGFWVAYVGIPAFIVTLAGMLLFRGLAIIFLTGGTIGGLPEGFVAVGARWMPAWLGHFADGRDVLTILIGLIAIAGMVVAQMRARGKLKARGLPRTPLALFIFKNAAIGAIIFYFAYLLSGYRGTPYILIVLSVLVVAYTFVLNRTVFGRHIYAMGGNRFAAVMSGVKTKKVDFYIFVNIGVLAALAGIVSTARAAGAVSSAGTFYELDAIAAVFIGGAAVQGGVGRISGTVTGALIMGVLNQGLSIMGVDSAWQQVIKGLVLLLAVAFDVTNRRRAGDR
ncbi:MAG: sugar ABC transporter permease [Demequinaceae bacterium]|nr:sugar ABC transporter permease [Demequinaceae bacterium]